ncbi:MAG: cyclase family protein, partial [Candidatus Omnitrophica bacterium]|nr:cyclase family protein [Candidatus Omnitrophota bacterium]
MAKDNVMFLSYFMGRNTPLYGGKNKVKIVPVREIKKGDTCNTLSLRFPNHASTHIDLPSHFLKKGKTLSDFSAPFWVFDNVQLLSVKLGSKKEINKSRLKNLNQQTDLLLIKTSFGKNRPKAVYYKDYPYFSQELAGYLKKRMPSLRAVGFDCISISSPKYRREGRRAHHEFLKRGIILIEDMKLGVLKKSPDRVIV